MWETHLPSVDLHQVGLPIKTPMSSYVKVGYYLAQFGPKEVKSKGKVEFPTRTAIKMTPRQSPFVRGSTCKPRGLPAMVSFWKNAMIWILGSIQLFFLFDAMAWRHCFPPLDYCHCVQRCPKSLLVVPMWSVRSIVQVAIGILPIPNASLPELGLRSLLLRWPKGMLVSRRLTFFETVAEVFQLKFH